MDQQKKAFLVFGFVREYCVMIAMPDDIVELFVRWLSMNDSFDKSLSHPLLDITIETNQDVAYEVVTKKTIKDWSYSTAIGSVVVSKGQIQEWRFLFQTERNGTPSMLLGIINEEMIQTLTPDTLVQDFTDGNYKGYGLWLASNLKYHINPMSVGDFAYGDQFDFKQNDTITMTLDLTQQESKHGLLSYTFNSKLRRNVTNISTDGKFTNMAFAELDIDKSYRCALCLHRIQESFALLV